MRQASVEYKNAMSQLVQPFVFSDISIYIQDENISRDATATTNTQTSFSDVGVIAHSNENPLQYVTFETGFFKVDNSQTILPNSAAQYIKREYVSANRCDSNGDFSTYPVVTINFANTHSAAGLTITFDENTDNYPKELQIQVYSGLDEIYSQILYPTSPELVIENDLPSFDSIVITIMSMKRRNSRARINQIVFGIVKTWTEKDIIDIDTQYTIDPITTSLPTTKLTWSVNNIDKEFDADNPTGVYKFMEQRQKAVVHYAVETENGKEYIRGGTFYTNGAPSTDSLSAKFEATDRLSNMTGTYYKGVYSSTAVSLYSLAEAVLQDANLEKMPDGSDPWILSSMLQNVYTKAPLPVASYRECLQLIANAGRCILRTDDEDRIIMELQIDPKVTASDNGGTPWSSSLDAFERSTDVEFPYVTFEPGYFRVDDTQTILPNSAPGYVKQGFISSAQSNSIGRFDASPVSMQDDVTYIRSYYYDGAQYVQDDTALTYDPDTDSFDVADGKWINNTLWLDTQPCVIGHQYHVYLQADFSNPNAKNSSNVDVPFFDAGRNICYIGLNGTLYQLTVGTGTSSYTYLTDYVTLDAANGQMILDYTFTATTTDPIAYALQFTCRYNNNLFPVGTVTLTDFYYEDLDAQNPTITLDYSFPYSTSEFSMHFDDYSIPSDFSVIFRDDEGGIIHQDDVTGNTSNHYTLSQMVSDFSSVDLEIIQMVNPYARARIERINRGFVSEQYLTMGDFGEIPPVTKQPILSSVNVKRYNYTPSSTTKEVYNETIAIDGTVDVECEYPLCRNASATVTGGTLNSATYYGRYAILNITANGDVDIVIDANEIVITNSIVSATYNNDGEPCEIENELITVKKNASDVAQWVGGYLINRNSYETNFREDYLSEINDVVYMDSDFEERFPARIIKLDVKYPSMMGSIKLRRLN